MSRRGISIGFQVFAMRILWPEFAYRRRCYQTKQIPTWVGNLQPTEESLLYITQISYTPPCPPRVHVLSPEIASNTPHRYKDGSLCLYFPRDLSWTPEHLISRTIVPWTILWLRCYELWCETAKSGYPEWFGLEAPHNTSDTRRKR